MEDPANDDPFEEFKPNREELSHQRRPDGGSQKSDEKPSSTADGKTPKPNGPTTETADWNEPDMGILELRRRPPPAFPIEVLGPDWGPWTVDAAKAAACPIDYVALPLITSGSALVGNARWAQATPGWKEPPHVWFGAVGDSGDGKSPGSDCLMRDVLPVIEGRMYGDFPERLHEWKQTVALDKAAIKRWEEKQRAAQKKGEPFNEPMPKPNALDVEPEKPRLRQYDVTVEQVAAILATAAPKGVMMVRDELVGWLDGMNAYNPAGRPFWIQAYGGRKYGLERRKHGKEPIEIEHLAVAVSGGTQPERLATLISGTDDGLLSRIQWGWPDPIPFELGVETPRVEWAIDALDKLRELELEPQPGKPPSPVYMPLTPEGQKLIRVFGKEMYSRRRNTAGLLKSAYGKARGTALRLSLVLEWLWWCGKSGMPLPPETISPQAFLAAAALVADYFMPMAERVYGDAAATGIERMMATLARWIIEKRPNEVHVRHLQRSVRLPGLRTAGQIISAADGLVEADWLRAPSPVRSFGRGKGRAPVVYSVNPKLYKA
jgi:hypothetical protein